MEYLNGSGNSSCCDTSCCYKFDVQGCAASVPYIQLTLVTATTSTIKWMNLNTGDLVNTKPAGFVTGACADVPANNQTCYQFGADAYSVYTVNAVTTIFKNGTLLTSSTDIDAANAVIATATYANIADCNPAVPADAATCYAKTTTVTTPTIPGSEVFTAQTKFPAKVAINGTGALLETVYNQTYTAGNEGEGQYTLRNGANDHTGDGGYAIAFNFAINGQTNVKFYSQKLVGTAGQTYKVGYWAKDRAGNLANFRVDVKDGASVIATGTSGAMTSTYTNYKSASFTMPAAGFVMMELYDLVGGQAGGNDPLLDDIGLFAVTAEVPGTTTTTTVTYTKTTQNGVDVWTDETGAVVTGTALTTLLADIAAGEYAVVPCSAGCGCTAEDVLPTGGTDGQVLTVQPDGSYAWETPASDITTTLTNTVSGHRISTYTNELGVAVDIKETVTKIDNATFNATTGLLSFEYTDENGTVTTAQTTIPVGDKYKTASTDCLAVATNVDYTLNVGAGLAYTALQDIILYGDAGNHMHGYVVSYDKTTGVMVFHSEQHTGAGTICSWTVNLDAVQAATTTETTTTLTGTVAGHAIGTYTNEVATSVTINETVTVIGLTGTVLTFVDEAGTTHTYDLAAAIVSAQTVTTLDSTVTGHKIGTYHNEAGAAVNINETVTALSIAGTTLTYVDEAGVSSNLTLPNCCETTAYGTAAPTVPGTVIGDTYYVTPLGTQADSANATAEYRWDGTKWVKTPGAAATAVCDTVFFNSTDPATATIFDTANPPVTNNNALKNLDCAVYVGTDGSFWSSNGTTYKTKVIADPLHQFEVKTATAAQTSVTLAKTPVLGTTGKVRVSRNGVDITSSWTWVGAVGTYNPADNYGCTIDANDKLQFEYEAY